MAKQKPSPPNSRKPAAAPVGGGRRQQRKPGASRETRPAPLLEKPAWPLSLPLAILLALLPALLGGALYLQTLNFDFALDDNAVIRDNRFIQKGWDGIGDILTTQYFAGYDPNTNAMTYRPTAMVMFAVEQSYWGMNPKGYHAVSVLLYALSGFVLFFVLRRLLQRYPPIVPLMASLLFMAHPIHVDVVANVKSRDEILATLFFLLALGALLRYVDSGKVLWQPVSWLLYAVALFSKETMIPTLAVIPAALYVFRNTELRRTLLLSLPYLLVFVLFWAIRSNIIGEENTTSPIKYLDNPLLAAKDSSERVGSTMKVLGLYLVNSLGVVRQFSDYSWNAIPLVKAAHPQSLLSLLAYGLMGGVTVWGLRKRNLWGFCGLFFIAMISIVSSIVTISSNAYADRFLYLPVLAFCIAAAGLLYLLMPRPDAGASPWKALLAPRSLMAMALLLGLTAAAAWKTHTHSPIWKDNLALFSYHVEYQPENARMLKSLGGEYARMAVMNQSGASTEQIQEWASKAIPLLEKATGIFGNMSDAYIHIGNAYIMLNQFDKAEAPLRRAIKLSPGFRFAYSSLGNVLYRQGKFQECAEIWEQINPNIMTETERKNHYSNMVLVYQRLGDVEKLNKYRQLAGQ